MLRAVRRARRRPGPRRQEGPARLPAVAAPSDPASRPGTRPFGPRPARLAHRVRGDRAGAPRHDLRRPGRRLATWSSRTTRWAPSRRRSLTGEWPFARAYVHAGDGRARRREDVEVARQPGLRLGAARRRRRPDGDPAGAAARTTTAPTGSGPTTTSTTADDRLGRWRARRRAPARARRRPTLVADVRARAGRRPRRAAGAAPRSTRWARRTTRARRLADDRRRRAALITPTLLDALLGVAL